jgi:cell division septal protein FtsQ
MSRFKSLTSRRKKNQTLRAVSAKVAWGRRVMLLSGFVMACVVGYYLVPQATAGWTLIQHVSISGAKFMKRGEILSLLNLPPDTTLWTIESSELETRLESHPWIASASVGRAFPNTLAVVIREREPAAAFQHAGGKLFLDQEGVVLSIVAEEATVGLPVFSGLSAISLLQGDTATRDQARLGVTVARILQDRFLGPLHIDLQNANEVIAETKDVTFRVNHHIEQIWPQYLALESTIQEGKPTEPYEIDLRYSDKVIVRQRG